MNARIRLLALLFTCALLSGAYAQTWCPFTGEEWWHDYNDGSGTIGYSYTVHSGDTVINGMVCQRFETRINAWNIPGQFDYAQELPPFMSTYENGLVLLVQSGQVDTLFVFDANPGDHWNIPFRDDIWYDVTDTGTAIVDGSDLRWSAVEVRAHSEKGDWILGWDTLVERIGLLKYFIEPSYSFSTAPGLSSLRCYSDPELAYQAALGEPCELPLWVPVRTGLDEQLRSFPNPAGEELWVEPPHALYRGRGQSLMDQLGRPVRIEHQVTDRNMIKLDVSGLVSGTYHFIVTDEHRIVGRTTFQVVH